jgi:hypothetical protein
MYACLECGERLPPRAKGGHREREYCSDKCRQRAYRKQQKQEQEIERLIQGAYRLPDPDPRVTRDRWRMERASLLQRCQLLEAERNVAQSEIKILEAVVTHSRRRKGRRDNSTQDAAGQL